MQLYTLKVRKTDLALITLLNSGVPPKVEKKETYFVFDATRNSDFVPQILTKREMYNTYTIKGTSPLLLALKKQ